MPSDPKKTVNADHAASATPPAAPEKDIRQIVATRDVEALHNYLKQNALKSRVEREQRWLKAALYIDQDPTSANPLLPIFVAAASRHPSADFISRMLDQSQHAKGRHLFVPLATAATSWGKLRDLNVHARLVRAAKVLHAPSMRWLIEHAPDRVHECFNDMITNDAQQLKQLPQHAPAPGITVGNTSAQLIGRMLVASVVRNDLDLLRAVFHLANRARTTRGYALAINRQLSTYLKTALAQMSSDPGVAWPFLASTHLHSFVPVGMSAGNKAINTKVPTSFQGDNNDAQRILSAQELIHGMIIAHSPGLAAVALHQPADLARAILRPDMLNILDESTTINPVIRKVLLAIKDQALTWRDSCGHNIMHYLASDTRLKTAAARRELLPAYGGLLYEPSSSGNLAITRIKDNRIRAQIEAQMLSKELTPTSSSRPKARSTL